MHKQFCCTSIGGDGSNQEAVAKMLTIYIEEAHAIDEWVLPESEVQVKNVNIKVHKTLEERRQVAATFIKDTNITCETVVDSMDAGNVADGYWGWPERLYVILDGVVVYQGGVGPFGYKLEEVQAWLVNKYGSRGESIEHK